jgi:hypothetical protein
MKARILPTEEFAEYGKTDTVIMMLSINKTEAGILMDWLESETEEPHVVQQVIGFLQAVCGYLPADVVNTDGRLSPANAAQIKQGRPEGTARGIHNLPGLHG